MTFSCPHCQAKYQMPDERVSGRTLRLKCRSCSHDMVVDGRGLAGAAPPAPAVTARRTNVIPAAPVAPTGGRASASPPPMPALPQEVAARLQPPARPALPHAGKSLPPPPLSAHRQRPSTHPPELSPRAASAPPPAMRSGLTTGFALGLLTGILLVGGPSLYRTAWESPEPTHVVSAPVMIAGQVRPVEVAEAPAELPEATESRKQLDAVTIHGKAAKDKEVRPAKKPETPAPQADPRREERDHLSDQERAKLALFDDKEVALPPLRPEQEESSKLDLRSSLSQADFLAVVNRNKSELTRCYETSLRAAGGQQAEPIKISVIVTVGPTGKVRSVETKGEGLPGLADCLERAPKRWAFAASGGESAFNFPLLFQPGRR